MPIAMVQFTLSEIAAGLTILVMIGSGIVWALSTRFASKKLLYLLRDKDAVDLTTRREGIDRQITELRRRIEECHAKHELAKAPFENMATALREMKDSLHEMAQAAAERDEKLIAVVAGLDKRLTLVESRKRRA